MKRFKISNLFFLVLLFSSCTNFFHNIIPPQEGEIINFQLEYTNGSRSVLQTPDSNNNITIIVPAETDVTSLIPIVKISEKAQIVPGTLNYLNKIFPEKDLLTLALDMYTANQNGTFKTWFLNLVLENDGIKIPKLEMPIDFTTPVPFIVISGQGNYKFYTVTVKKESSSQDNNNNNDENKNDNNNDDSQEKDYDNLILSFEVPSQIAESVIEHTVTGGNNEIIQDSNNLGDSVPYSGIVTFEVDENTNLKEILPIVTVSEGANVLPLTQNYLLSLGLSFEQILQFYSGYSTTSDVEKYIYSFIKKLDNITYPSLDTPINFYNNTVYFAVISKNKDVKIYYINCKVKNIEPKLLNIAFSKTTNPYLIKDSKSSVDTDQIDVTCLYPMDMEIDYELIPHVVFEGDRITFTMPSGNETELISGETKIPFSESVRTCTITVYNSNVSKEYQLHCPIELDPDSIRSITDFRFYKSKNTDIKKTVIASIYNEGDTGFISATVMYEGEIPPYQLISDFITPGIVTKNGEEIISSVTSENFEYKTQYLCTAKNGLYCRLYDISIEFVQIITEDPVMTSFEFPVYLNKDLSNDVVASIDDLTNSIRCEVLYFTENPPYNLVPVFSSNGEVTCNSIIQTSGFSEENFKYTTYYEVTTGVEEKITKRYRVDVSFVRDSSSSCDILDFTFESKNNATLSSDVDATVTQRSQSIFAFMPYGAGSNKGTLLTPTFTSNGTVSVNGQIQTSGISSQDFSSPVTYTVTSVNGLYTKDYIVSLQESGDIIFVDINAIGRNNGTSWQDAFINLDLALEKANSVDDSILQEIWITADEYEPILNKINGFNVRSNLILRGGFNGTESSIDEREVDTDNNLINHTVLKRTPFSSNEESLFYANKKFTGTFTIDGFDIDLEQTANETFLDIIKVLNPIDVTENSKIETNNCLVSVKTKNGGCRLFYSEKDSNDLWDTATKPTNNIKIANTTINAETIDGIDVTSHTGDILIQNTKTNCNLFMVGKNVTIENSSFDNQLYTVTEKPDNKFHLTNLNDSDSSAQIKNSYFNNLVIKAYHDITMEDSILENCALHTEGTGLSNLNMINTNLTLLNVNGYALEYGSLCMNNSILKADAQTGRGCSLIQIEDSEFSIYNLRAWTSVQKTSYYEGNSFIKNSTITATGSSVVLGGYIGGTTQYYASKDFRIENSNFIGYEIYFYSENLTIKDSDFSFPSTVSLFDSLYFETKNLVLEGNEFDTNETQITSTTLPVYAYRLYFNDGITMESSEIKDNTFDHFMQLFLYSNYNGTDVRYYNFENNYFKTSSYITSSGTINLNLINNTFEDLEYIDAQNATISKYENNKVVNKNSSRGYKCIRVKEFSYTEFNYENFCYFNSSGELSFNNCIIEPCTQTYSLPQGDFTFRSYIGVNGDFITPLDSYITLNNCIVNSDFENDGTIVVEECTNFQIGRLDNNGDFTINDSYVQYGNISNYENGKVVLNDSSSSGSFIYNYSNFEFNNINSTFIGLNNYGNFAINNSNVTNGEYIWNEGTFTINNSNINLTSTDGLNILHSTGNLSINGGTFNLKSTQGGNSLDANKGSLSINGGTFNFEHAGDWAPMYVACDATISDAKFNFTGEDYTSNYCVSFPNVTNGSTIKNCEFIIDKCARSGFYAGKAGLKIENSKFDINVYPQNSGDTCYGFYGYKDFSIDGGTYDLGNLYKSSSANMSIKNATVTANCPTALRLTENSVIENSTVNLNVTDEDYILNYSDNIKNTNFNFAGEASSSVWINYSSSLAKCNFNFLNIKPIDSGTFWSGTMNLKTSCSILDCFFYGANVGNSSSGNKRGGAIAIEHRSGESSFIFENCTFSNNRITSSPNSGVWEAGGGGISVLSEANDCTVVFKDCNFMNNFSSTGTAYHLFVNNWNSAYTNCNILFSGTNTMTGPKCPVQIFNGGKSYENEAIYVSGFTVTGTIN